MGLLDSLKNDSDFLALDPESKRQVLAVKDPEFSALGADDQKSVITSAFPGAIGQDHPVARFASKIYTPLLEGGAMAIGGAAGAATPAAPVAAPALSIAMYPVGKQAAHGLDRALGLPNPNDPSSLGEAAMREVKDLGEGTVIEGGGRAAKLALAPIMNTFAEPFTSTYYNDLKALASKFDIPLTAAMRAGSAGLARIESATSKFPMAQGIIKAANDRVKEAIERNVVQRLISQGTSVEDANAVGARILERISQTQMGAEAAPVAERAALMKGQPVLNPEKAGQAIQKDLAAQSVNHSTNIVQPAYEAISRAAGSIEQEAPALRAAASDALKQIGQAKTFDPGLVNKLRALAGAEQGEGGQAIMFGGTPIGPEHPMYARLATELGQQPGQAAAPVYSYSALKNELDSLKSLAVGQNAAPGMGARFQSTPEGRIYSKLAEAADADLNGFGGKDLGALRTRATAVAKEGYDKFSTDYVRGILNANPEDVAGLALKPGNVTDVRNLMQTLSPDGQQVLKNQLLNKILAGPEDELFSREALSKNLSKYGDTLKEIFNPKELSDLQGVAAARSNIPIESPFFRRYLQDSAQANPARVISFLTSKGTTPQAINKVHAAIGDELFGNFQDQALLRFGTDATGKFDPIRFYKNVEKVGLPTYRAMTAGDKAPEAQALYQLSRAYGTVEREAGNPSGTAQAYSVYRLLLEAFHNPKRAAKDLSLATGMAIGHTLPTEQWIANPLRTAADVGPGVGSMAARTALMERFRGKEQNNGGQ